MKKRDNSFTSPWENRFQTLTYFLFAGWAMVFLIFTPVSFSSVLATATIMLWLGSTLIGGLTAMLGSILHIDFKLELPGLILMLIGPGFYTLVLSWYLFFPPAGSTDHSGHYHLVVLALYLFAIPLPRIAKLHHSRKQATRLKQQSSELPELTDEQKAQPGAFPELEVGDK